MQQLFLCWTFCFGTLTKNTCFSSRDLSRAGTLFVHVTRPPGNSRGLHLHFCQAVFQGIVPTVGELVRCWNLRNLKWSPNRLSGKCFSRFWKKPGIEVEIYNSLIDHCLEGPSVQRAIVFVGIWRALNNFRHFCWKWPHDKPSRCEKTTRQCFQLRRQKPSTMVFGVRVSKDHISAWDLLWTFHGQWFFWAKRWEWK